MVRDNFALQPTKRATARRHSGCRPFHGLRVLFNSGSWGLRPRLYAVTCFAGWSQQPRAREAGESIKPRAQALGSKSKNVIEPAKRATARRHLGCRPFHGLACFLILDQRPRAREAGESIKPRAQALGSKSKNVIEPAKRATARRHLGCRPFHGLACFF